MDDTGTYSPTVQLTMGLMARPSVTPNDAGCQDVVAKRLAALGFECERLRFGDVDNLWAHRGAGAPRFVFLGHTDVVPTGPAEAWASDPFAPTVRDGRLYGRGAADMKGSIGAFVTACERFLAGAGAHRGTLGILLTSDEEGPATDGTVRVVQALHARGEAIDHCLVGEPSSTAAVGDVVKNGRRGSLGARIVVKGVQGHVAYPHLVDNPIHRFARALAALDAERWDAGNAHFPPTSFQVSNVRAGTGATNVVPGTLEALFNFRYSTEVSREDLERRVGEILAAHGADCEIEWSHSGAPFLTASGALVDAARAAIEAVTGVATALSTAGGTSDGRFVAPLGAEVLELGPVNATIHSVDENVTLAELDTLSAIYEGILERLIGG